MDILWLRDILASGNNQPQTCTNKFVMNTLNEETAVSFKEWSDVSAMN